jgi:hypothetical protein
MLDIFNVIPAKTGVFCIHEMPACAGMMARGTI